MADMMTTTGKTLSVTYGNFSCRIEGYDAPLPLLAEVLDTLRASVGHNSRLGAEPVDSSALTALASSGLGARAELADGVLRLSPPEIAPDGIRGARIGDSRFDGPAPLYALSPDEIAAFAEPDIGENPEPASSTRERRVMPEAALPESEFGADPETEADDPAMPLILLASQRIDLPRSAEPRPLPPLKLMPHELAAPKYPPIAVERLNAVLAEVAPGTLAERMEAVAAYLMLVEGWSDFTRPALLRTLSQTADAPYPFDEELKAFGMLVREERFVRLGDGRFAVAEDSAYMDESHSITA